jgi:dolichol-phosphate mannosyltransferase
MVADSGLLISIVSPVYRAENLVDLLVTEITKALSPVTSQFEIILVEDGSPDQSWSKIVQNCERDKRVKGIKLSRNFGQHNAITAGLQAAKGEWVVVMDCDLQDRPEEIPHLFQKAMEGYDVVFAVRAERQDSFSKKLSSKIFYALFSFLTDTKQDSRIANFGIFHRKVIQAILSMQDYIRYFPTMSQLVGFNRTYLDVKHSERAEGKSSYNWSKLLNLAFNNIIAFSDKPLRLTIWFGVLIVCFSFVIGIAYLIKYFLGHVVVLGFTSLIVSLWFLSGIIISILGIVGVYVGKNFEKVKGRPVYIIDESLNRDA